MVMALFSPVNKRLTRYTSKSRASPHLGGWRIKRYLGEKENFDVTVVNTDLLMNGYSELPVNIDIAGVCSYYTTRENDVSLGKRLKQRFDAELVYGGPNPSFQPEWYFENGEADYVVKGEGEKPLRDITQGLHKTQDVVENSLTEKEWRRYTTGTQWEEIKWKQIWELNQKLFNSKPALRLVTMNGCTKNCTFCTSRNLYEELKYLRTRELKLLMERCGELLPRNGLLYLQGDDELLGPCRNRFTELAEKNWKAPRNVLIQTSPEAINTETTEALKKVGVTKVGLGIESFEPSKLKKWRKNTTKNINETAIETLVNHGIKVYGNILAPGEETIKKMNELKEKHTEHIEWSVNQEVKTLPGSEMWKNTKQQPAYT